MGHGVFVEGRRTSQNASVDVGRVVIGGSGADSRQASTGRRCAPGGAASRREGLWLGGWRLGDADHRYWRHGRVIDLSTRSGAFGDRDRLGLDWLRGGLGGWLLGVGGRPRRA